MEEHLIFAAGAASLHVRPTKKKLIFYIRNVANVELKIIFN